MSYTLLQLVSQVSGEMGLAQPSVVIGSTTNQTIQMLALVQRLGKDLVREFEWQRLQKIRVFQTTAATTTTGNLTSGSTTVSGIPSTAALSAGLVMTGTGVAPYAEIASVDSSTQVTMTMPATATGTGTSLTFAVQDYSMPADYDRMISDSNWDRTDHWRNLGPKSSQEWQQLQGGVISIGPRERFRILGNKLRIFPALTSVYNMSFEYISQYWVLAASDMAATKGTFTVDTDTCIFPDDLMCAGLKMYFLKAKKLDYAPEVEEFSRALSASKAQDSPNGTKSLAPNPMPELVGPWSLPDGSWPTS